MLSRKAIEREMNGMSVYFYNREPKICIIFNAKVSLPDRGMTSIISVYFG